MNKLLEKIKNNKFGFVLATFMPAGYLLSMITGQELFGIGSVIILLSYMFCSAFKFIGLAYQYFKARPVGAKTFTAIVAISPAVIVPLAMFLTKKYMYIALYFDPTQAVITFSIFLVLNIALIWLALVSVVLFFTALLMLYSSKDGGQSDYGNVYFSGLLSFVFCFIIFFAVDHNHGLIIRSALLFDFYPLHDGKGNYQLPVDCNNIGGGDYFLYTSNSNAVIYTSNNKSGTFFIKKCSSV